MLTVDQWHTRTIGTTFTDAFKVAVKEVGTTNLQVLLNDLGSKLVHAVLSGIAKDVVNGTRAIVRGAVVTDVLDTPVAELTVSDDIDARKDLFNAVTLSNYISECS